MNNDVVRAMLRSLPDVKETSDGYHFEGFDVTLHTGRAGAPFSVQQVQKVTISDALLIGETRKGQRFAVLIEEIRGLVAEPLGGEKSGRKTGFM